MTQHTPGPWKLNKSPMGATFVMSTEGWVAELSMLNSEANARLIAKAPEMLAMLASCLAYFDDMRNGGYAAATPDAAWTAPIRALLKDIEEGRP